MNSNFRLFITIATWILIHAYTKHIQYEIPVISDLMFFTSYIAVLINEFNNGDNN